MLNICDRWHLRWYQVGTDIIPGPISSSPSGFVEMNGVVYFSAVSSNVFGVELWRTDGTERGTYLLSDISFGINNSAPADLQLWMVRCISLPVVMTSVESYGR